MMAVRVSALHSTTVARVFNAGWHLHDSGKYHFLVAEITFKVAVIFSSVVKIIFKEMALENVNVMTNMYTI